MGKDSTFRRVEGWISKVTRIPEGAANLRLFDLDIQFHIKGEDSFVLSLKDGSVSMRKGNLVKADPGNTVVVESDGSTINQLLDGRAKFLDEWRADRIYLVGELPRRAWFSRMIRIGSVTD